MTYRKTVVFDIREYVGTKQDILDNPDKKLLEILKDSSTQWKVRCPSCGGKLVVNKNHPKYMCVTDWCSTNDIRRELGVSTFQPYERQTKIPVRPIYLPSNFALTMTEKIVDTISTTSNNYIDKRKLVTTTYNYGNNCKVVRHDIYVNNKRVDKEFRPYKDNVPISYNDLWLYQEEDLKPGIHIWVEGEKCVDALLEQGYSAFTVAGGVSCNEDYIVKRISLNLHLLKGVVIIPDNDKAGIKKARLVEEACWKCGIPTFRVNMERYDDVLSPGEDIVDLLELGYTLPEVIYG